jgi:hypothetical protein
MSYEIHDDEQREQERHRADWAMDFEAVKSLAADLLDAQGWAGYYTFEPDMIHGGPNPHRVSRIGFPGSDQRLTIEQPSLEWPDHDTTAHEIDGRIASVHMCLPYSYMDIDAVFQRVIGAIGSPPPFPPRPTGHPLTRARAFGYE